MLTLADGIIYTSGAYLAIRGFQESYKFLKKKFHEDFLPLKQAAQYKKIPEVYHYHLFNIAQKLINQEKPSKSKKYLERILSKDPEYQQANYLMGVVAFAEKDYRKARLHLEKEIEHNPTHHMIYFFLSQAYLKLSQYDQALRAVDRALELNPYYYSSYFLALDIFSRIKEAPEREWHFFSRAEEYNCLTRPVWLHMAHLEEEFLPEDRLAERKEFYDSLENNWHEAGQLKEKAFRALANKQFYKAESFALEGLHINPHDNQWYQLYDQILIAQQKFSHALEFYRKSYTRINFNPLEATLRLVDYYVFNKDYKNALELMLSIFREYPNAKFLHYPLGVLYNWVNKPQQALEQLRKAIYYDRGVKKLVTENPELKNLRQYEEFQQLL